MAKIITVQYESERYEVPFKIDDTIQAFKETLREMIFKEKGVNKIDQIRVVMLPEGTENNQYVLFEPSKKINEYAKDFGEIKDGAFVKVDLRSESYVRVKREKKSYFIYVDSETTVREIKQALEILIDGKTTSDFQLMFDNEILQDDSLLTAYVKIDKELAAILKLNFKIQGTENFDNLPLDNPKYVPIGEKIKISAELKKKILDMRAVPKKSDS